MKKIEKTRLFYIIASLLCAGALHGCSGGKTNIPDRPFDIAVQITKIQPALQNSRIPINFNPALATTLTVNLQIRNFDGSIRTQFTGEHAWVRLNVNPGNILDIVGPLGPNSPDVVAQNVKLTNGQIEGLQVRVRGSYGNVRLIAENVGFSPASVGKVAACADGIDNNGDGFADFPNDPNCFFQNDDSENSFDATFGSSDIIPFEFPTLADVQGRSLSSPFTAQQIEVLGNDRQLVVTALTNDGMYVTDYNDFDKNNGTYNSIFVFNFSTPFDVQICDRLTRLRGNISEFFGFTELGTPSWSKISWINEAVSGPCLISDFYEIASVTAQQDQRSIEQRLEAYESSLVRVLNPTIGDHWGAGRPANGIPTTGASNCDLDGDGVVGFDNKKSTFRQIEKDCNDSCSSDVYCTEWNNYQSRGQVAIKLENSNAKLFLQPGLVPTFNPELFVGLNKIAELRGVLRDFRGPTPAFTLQVRCDDDIVLVNQDTTKKPIKNAKNSCIRRRVEPDTEGSN